jgi:hypothetical protein
MIYLLTGVNGLILWMTLFNVYLTTDLETPIETILTLKLKGGMIINLENLGTMPNHETIDECPCEGLNCYNLADRTIEIPAGTYGKIRLQLCEKCMSKFSVREASKNININSKGLRENKPL